MENNKTVLVTGGSGFVGSQLILQLLQNGYQVRATLRNTKSIDKIKATLKAHGISSFEQLSFVEAELTNDQNWDLAMKGCQYVLSVASPIFFGKPKNEEEVIQTASSGILRILKFAKQTGVQRVVMTANFGAIGFTQRDKSRKTTEKDWTDTNAKGLSLYEKSKTLAEKAAWEFMQKEGGQLEFTTINPVAILGPSLDEHISGSFILIKMLLNGSLKAVPNLPLNVVDVRDVAALHILAMENPKAAGQRFIASCDGQISLQQMAELISRERPELNDKLVKKKLPMIALQIATLFSHLAKESVFLSRMNRDISNDKAKQMLGWTPIASQEATVLAAVDSLIKYNLIE